MCQLQLLAQRTRRRPKVVNDGEVELAILEPRARFHGLHLDDVELHIGMSRVKVLDRGGNQGAAGTLESSQAKPARPRLQISREVSLGVLDAPQDCLGVTEQDLAGLGEPRAL